MLNQLTVHRAAILVLAIAFATIAGAWVFEYFGYAPCELCLKQRWAYYAGVPIALILSMIAPANPKTARLGLYILALIWIASMVFGIYHSGVEWKLWAGPAACTGGGGLTGLPDLSKPVVMCDQPSLRIFGLSLAGWNAILSLAMAVIALKGARAKS
jgi:disulfide bond formation protein DsbB